MTTPGQNRTIHAMRNKGLMDNREYRALLTARFGKHTSADLTDGEAARLIDELRQITGVAPTHGRKIAATASGRYAPVMRALWISAWHLGLTRSRDDAALISFVQRQTGVEHLRFLSDPQLAAKAIEALKGWITREAGVEWPTDADAKRREVSVAWARKEAIARAAAAKLAAAGDPDITDWAAAELAGRQRGLPQTTAQYGEYHWDRLIEFLGGRIREPAKRKTRRAA